MVRKPRCQHHSHLPVSSRSQMTSTAIAKSIYRLTNRLSSHLPRFTLGRPLGTAPVRTMNWAPPVSNLVVDSAKWTSPIEPCKMGSVRSRFPSWPISLTWTLGLILFTGLSINEICPLIYEYINNNVGTQTSIVGENARLRPPLLTMCLPWTSAGLERIVEYLEIEKSNNNGSQQQRRSDCPICDQLTSRGWDAWTELDAANWSSNFEENVQTVASRMIRQLLRSSDDEFRILSTDNSEWNGALIDSVWELVYCIKKLDLSILAPSSSDNIGRRGQWCFDDPLVDELLSNTPRIDALYGRMVDVLCEYVDVRIEYDRPDKFLCRRILARTPAMLHEDQFCYAVPFSNLNLTTLFISSRSRNRYGPDHTRGGGGWRSGWALYQNTDYLGLETGESFFSFPIYVSSEQRPDFVHIGYAVSGQVIDRRHSECYKDRTPAVCRSNCLLAVIRDQCGCEPFVFRNHRRATDQFVEIERYCNSSAYSNCQLNVPVEIERCERRCEYQCVYTTYQFSAIRQGSSNRGRLINRPKSEYEQWRRTGGGTGDELPEFYLVIYPLSKMFTEFVITRKNTWEQFVSQVGAVINLYLGVSGISAIASLIVLGRLVSRCFESMRKNERQGATMVQQVPTMDKGSVEKEMEKKKTMASDDWKADMEAKYVHLESMLKQLQSTNEKT